MARHEIVSGAERIVACKQQFVPDPTVSTRHQQAVCRAVHEVTTMCCRICQPLAFIAASAALWVPGIGSAAGDVPTTVNANTPVVEAKFLMAIREPGSYRLTENIVVADANTTAIEIDADDVTIDMNGFSIHGPGKCTSPPVSCAPTGIGNGIHTVGRNNIVVKNGGIHGMGNVGIYLETNSASVGSVELSGNGGGGIAMFGGIIDNSIVERNGGDGITGVDIILQQGIIRDNQQSGFKAYGKSLYANSTFSGNNGNAAQVDVHPRQAGGNSCNAEGCP